MPSTIRPKGTNGSLSLTARLSTRLMNTWVARPFFSANANATVPRVFDSRNGSSGIVRVRHACAASGRPLMPNWAHFPATTRKKAESSYTRT